MGTGTMSVRKFKLAAVVFSAILSFEDCAVGGCFAWLRVFLSPVGSVVRVSDCRTAAAAYHG